MMMTSEQATEGTRVVLGATWGFWENTGNGEAFRRANADLPGTITRVIGCAVGVALDDGRRVRADLRSLSAAVRS